MRRVLMFLATALVAVGAAGCGATKTSSAPSPSRPGATKPGATKPSAPEVSPSGDIPDNQVYVRYAVPGQPLELKVPEGWSRRTSAAGIVFTDNLNSIALRVTRAARAPTAAGTSTPAGGRATTVHRTAGPAVRVTYLARSTPDAVTGKSRTDAVERYLFFHNGRELVLTLSGPKGADNVDPWRLVTDSVRWR